MLEIVEYTDIVYLRNTYIRRDNPIEMVRITRIREGDDIILPITLSDGLYLHACTRCGHTWTSRKRHPQTCPSPKCRSPYYFKKRKDEVSSTLPDGTAIPARDLPNIVATSLFYLLDSLDLLKEAGPEILKETGLSREALNLLSKNLKSYWDMIRHPDNLNRTDFIL